jgi:hypothetical protein
VRFPNFEYITKHERPYLEQTKDKSEYFLDTAMISPLSLLQSFYSKAIKQLANASKHQNQFARWLFRSFTHNDLSGQFLVFGSILLN